MVGAWHGYEWGNTSPTCLRAKCPTPRNRNLAIAEEFSMPLPKFRGANALDNESCSAAIRHKEIHMYISNAHMNGRVKKPDAPLGQCDETHEAGRGRI